MPAHGDRRDRVPRPLGDLVGGLGVAVRQDQRELLAADPGGGARAARRRSAGILPIDLRTSSPYGCPWASLTALKLSRSSITRASGLVAAGALQALAPAPGESRDGWRAR